jgi:hypothetical protein
MLLINTSTWSGCLISLGLVEKSIHIARSRSVQRLGRSWHDLHGFRKRADGRDEARPDLSVDSGTSTDMLDTLGQQGDEQVQILRTVARSLVVACPDSLLLTDCSSTIIDADDADADARRERNSLPGPNSEDPPNSRATQSIRRVVSFGGGRGAEGVSFSRTCSKLNPE